MSDAPRIETLSAYLLVDEEGNETVCAHNHIPLLGADHEEVKAQRPYALAVAHMTGCKVILAQFSARLDLEVIAP